jgi:hypothetical protein
MARLLPAVRTLRAFQALQQVTSVGQGRATPVDSAGTRLVSRAIMRDMAVRDSAIGAKLVVVYLPTIDDFKGKASDSWRQAVRDAAAQDGYQYVDLVEELRRVAPDSVDGLFIPRGQLAFRGAAGHYTESGNVWVERLLREKVPELAGK